MVEKNKKKSKLPSILLLCALTGGVGFGGWMGTNNSMKISELEKSFKNGFKFSHNRIEKLETITMGESYINNSKDLGRFNFGTEDILIVDYKEKINNKIIPMVYFAKNSNIMGFNSFKEQYPTLGKYVDNMLETNKERLIGLAPNNEGNRFVYDSATNQIIPLGEINDRMNLEKYVGGFVNHQSKLYENKKICPQQNDIGDMLTLAKSAEDKITSNTYSNLQKLSENCKW